MNDINLIESCKAHLPVQYASNSLIISQKWHWFCDWQSATRAKQAYCLLHGCLCSHWLLRFPVLHSNKTINKITY